jgi:hypothetical protein
MAKNLLKILWLTLPAVILTLFSTMAWSANLPLNKELTVRLSTVASAGALAQVADARATTDALGKITFSFASVPDSTVASGFPSIRSGVCTTTTGSAVQRSDSAWGELIQPRVRSS